MPKRDKTSELPSDIKEQLHQRLIASNFGDYTAHSAWLLERGFAVSKSALHRYAQEHESAISVASACDDGPPQEIRMRCLEVAATLGASNETELLRRAQTLMSWVVSG